jgi:hypothetical protein
MAFLVLVVMAWVVCIDTKGQVVRPYEKLGETGISIVDKRLHSGVARFSNLALTQKHIIDSFPFGSKVSDRGIFGSLILTNGYRAGILAAILTAILYFKIYGLVYDRLHMRSRNHLEQFGLCLLYSLLLQGMVYNDYGFSTYYGVAMLMVVLVTMDGKKRFCIEYRAS